MTIYSHQRRVDARIASGILASSVLKSLDEQSEDLKDSLTNIVRLLEMYRHRSFATSTSHGVLQRPGLNEIDIIDDQCRESAIRSVATSLETAHKRVFGDQPVDVVVDTLEQVLHGVASNDLDQLDPDDLDKTKRFLASFVEALTK